MIGVETHEIVFSFDQPGDARSPLFAALQQLMNLPQARSARATSLISSRKILVIDSAQERAQHVASLLASAGYWPLAASTPLDAFTLFIQGTFIPFAVIVSQDDLPNQFFLARLSQQVAQRYGWQVPFIHLRIPPSRGFGSPSGPLSSTYTPPPPSQALRMPQMQQLLPASDTFIPQPGPSTDPLLSPSSTGASFRTRTAPLGSPSHPLTPLPPTHLPPQQPETSAAAQQESEAARKMPEKIRLDDLNIGRYQLISAIGGNPLGDVYRAYDRLRERDVAIKTIQANLVPFHLMEGREDDYNLFQAEQDVLTKLEHPRILSILNINKSYISGFPFVYKTMPLCSEGSLAGWCSRNSTSRLFPPQEVIQVILQLAEALQFVHDQNIIYQNMKIANVLVQNQAETMSELSVAICDFPFVKDPINLPKNIESYRYVAPEQWEGQVLPASDQYALAVVAYELMAGRPPFQGQSDAIMKRMHLGMPAPRPSSFNSTLSPFIDKVLLCALSKRPEDRFSSVSAFASTLAHYCN